MIYRPLRNPDGPPQAQVEYKLRRFVNDYWPRVPRWPARKADGACTTTAPTIPDATTRNGSGT